MKARSRQREREQLWKAGGKKGEVKKDWTPARLSCSASPSFALGAATLRA